MDKAGHDIMPEPGRRRKVLHLVVAGDIGGAERFLVGLASRPDLTGADHCIAVVSPNPELAKLFRVGGIDVIGCRTTSENALAYLWRTFGPRDAAWLRDQLRDSGADLLHLHTFASHLLGARVAVSCGLPAIRTEHGIRHYRDPSCAIYRHWSLQHMARIVVVSEFVGRYVASVAPNVAANIRVVHNGVDIDQFKPVAPRQKASLLAVVVSRLESEKRVDLAIGALALAPAVRLQIVGGGSRRGRLQKLAYRLGVADRVTFLGYQPDPRNAIAEADVLINCTRQEALGLAVLEAAAMQRPAIAFGDGGIPEIIEHGHTGWIVREHSAKGFAEALNEAGRQPAAMAACGVEARRWVEAEFNIETMCKKYAAIYRDVIDGAPDKRRPC